MGQAKIDFKVGSIQFSAEGEQEWIAKQLDKIISKALDFAIKIKTNM